MTSDERNKVQNKYWTTINGKKYLQMEEVDTKKYTTQMTREELTTADYFAS